jgi:ABC-type antimicrobial peptide transport system permease subunit
MGILTRATKNLSRRKTRALIVIIALTLALTMLIILPSSINARQELTHQAITNLISTNDYLTSTVTLSATEVDCGYPISFDPSMGVVGNGTTVWTTQPLMNETIYSKIISLPDVTKVIPVLHQLATADRAYQIYGIPLDNASDLEDSSILPSNITEGRTLQVGDQGVVVVDEYVAKNFSVSVGDTFAVSGHSLTVVGIEGPAPLQGWFVTMSLADAQAVTNATGQASAYKVFVDDIDNVNTVVARIRSVDSKLQVSDGLSQLNSAAPLQSQVDKLTQAAQTNLNQIQTIGFVEVGIAIVADTAIILFIMLYSVRERTKEIGTLKAIGASNPTILGQLMFEGVLLSLIAAVLAIIIGVVAVPTLSSILLPTPVQTGVTVGYYPNGTMSLSNSSFGSAPILTGNGSNVIAAPITIETILMGVGIAVLLGALGSLYPALKAARTKPAEAMRYE